MSKRIIITTSLELVSVPPDDIVFVKSDGNYSDMVLTDGSELSFTFNLMSFEQLLIDQLDEDATKFLRIGRSLIINRDYIYRINPSKQELLLAAGPERRKFLHKPAKDALRQIKKLLESEL